METQLAGSLLTTVPTETRVQISTLVPEAAGRSPYKLWGEKALILTVS